MKLAFWTVTKGAGNIAREYKEKLQEHLKEDSICLLYTSPSPRD